MFRRLPNSLPPDPTAPSDLEQLGYFINDNDQIRMIRNPENKYVFRIDRNDRVNEVYKEAMNNCVRRIVKQRLLDAGLEVLRLPIGATKTDRHVPIYVSKNLKNKKRVLVIFGQRNQDAGIFSFRTTGDDGINIGSGVDMVKAVLDAPAYNSDNEIPGIIWTNPGQLLWYCGGTRAVGDIEWLNLPRASAVHEPFRIDPVKNRVPGNSNYVEHVKYVFEHVMSGRVCPDAKFELIGMEYMGMEVMLYLSQNWDVWSQRITGVCLGNPQHTIDELKTSNANEAAFLNFVKKRVRGYFVSDAKVETPVPGVDRCGCNCYASGEQFYEEDILTRGWRSMLDWFNMINNVDCYEEPTFSMIEVGSEQSEIA